MKIITRKQQIKIAKHLAALRIISTMPRDTEFIDKHVENVFDIAFALGVHCEVSAIVDDYYDRINGENA